jgi:predicted ferric reductase
MKNNHLQNVDLEAMPPVMTLESLVMLLLAILVGVFMAAVALPSWLPGLSTSLFGSEPKVYWYLSRGSAVVAFVILWLSMALGLMITNKMARLWPGGPVAFDLHQYTSILGLAFAFFHALILIGDAYINYTFFQVLIPFGSINYHPFWVGVGQISFYLWILVVLSFYVRSQMGTRTWRLVHFVSYVVLAMALVHGIASGTDSGTVWATRMYWYAGGSLLFLTIYRVFINMKIFSPDSRPKTS